MPAGAGRRRCRTPARPNSSGSSTGSGLAAARSGCPTRRWASPCLCAARADATGVIALVDPQQRAGPFEQMALEHATTVLAVELARLHSLGEAELRLRRDLVEELLAGTDDESALGRAQALGHDLECPHRV